jgi:hypothetical protein
MKFTPESHRRDYTVLFGVCLAVGLRIWNIDWGLPELYEEATPFFKAWNFWNWGATGFDFNPHFFNYPAFSFYFQFIGQGLHFLVGSVLGWYPDLTAFSRAFQSNPDRFFILARSITVLFDLGTVILVYRIARETGEKLLPPIAAILAAINILLIQQSQFVNVDTPLTFFTTLTVLSMRRLYTSASVKRYVSTGILIGIAASTKYTGALLLLALLAVHFLRVKNRDQIGATIRDTKIYWAFGVSGITFLALNPFILLRYEDFFRDFGFEQQHMSAGHLGIQTGQNPLVFYLLKILPDALGLVFCLFILFALVRMVVGRDRENGVYAIFPIICIAVISSWEMRADRYILPAIPSLIVIGCIGIVDLSKLIAAKWRASRARSREVASVPIVVIAFALMLLPGLHELVSVKDYLGSAGLPDTRAISKEWIFNNIPGHSIIAMPPYGIEFPPGKYDILSIPFLPVNPERVAAFYDPGWYEDFDLVIASDYDYGRYLLDPARFAPMLKYYKTLQRSWSKIFEVSPSGSQTGPAVWLYRYPDSLRKARFDSTLFNALAGVPESSRVSNFLKNLTSLLQKKGRLAKVDQLMGELLAVEYRNVDMRRSHSAVLYDLGRYQEALSEVRICVRFDSTRADLFWLEGIIYRRLGNSGSAELSFIRALELNPAMEDVYDQLLAIYVERRDKYRAIDILTRHLKLVIPGTEKARKIESDIQTLRQLP